MQYSKILSVVFVLAILTLAIGAAQFKKSSKKYSDEFKTMPRTANLTEVQRRELMDSCRSLGMKCKRAEDCCTLLCLKRPKVCVV